MAHIPYGYEIAGGQGVLNYAECGRVRLFISHYLRGDPIRLAGEKAGIPLSISSLRHILGNPVYLGDDYYPPLIDRETFDMVQAERQERHERLGCFTSDNSTPPVRVQHCFRIKPESEKQWQQLPAAAKAALVCPAKKAAYIYTLVAADCRGERKMSAAEKSLLTRWIGEHIGAAAAE